MAGLGSSSGHIELDWPGPYPPGAHSPVGPRDPTGCPSVQTIPGTHTSSGGGLTLKCERLREKPIYRGWKIVQNVVRESQRVSDEGKRGGGPLDYGEQPEFCLKVIHSFSLRDGGKLEDLKASLLWDSFVKQCPSHSLILSQSRNID